MRVILGADHGGFGLKEETKKWLTDEGFEVFDVGACFLVEEDDFVEYAKKAVQEAKDREDRIILFCKNGFGMCIAANRFTGVRCGLAFDLEAVRRGRTDDDINCLSVPAEYKQFGEVVKMVDIFLHEDFSEEEKYKRRINKLDNLL
ncbi:MAG TPA: RpiB/LacA/LacB family sugar-phosphate isomerase [Candidatus Woesebacteria bacterium]|nr:RpiB/LacA/LacB family sugar-phosphate isomerase [Candidatus Woesebacteria bacterium]